MQKNVGSREKYVRIGFGAVASGLAFSPWVEGWQRWALGGVGLAGLATGISGYCPINAALGINRGDFGMREEAKRIAHEGVEEWKSAPLGSETGATRL